MKDSLLDRVDISGAVIKLEDQEIRSRVNFFILLAATAVFGALVAIAMFHTVTIQDNSMEPTLQISDSYFINQVIYRVGTPRRGDIVVFKVNGNENAAWRVSRIIGLPGEDIYIYNGRIYIDGEIYGENGRYPDISNPGLAADTISLSNDEYFVLGDNRNNSEDSRYSTIGNVKKGHIIGKLWFRLQPGQNMGFV